MIYTLTFTFGQRSPELQWLVDGSLGDLQGGEQEAHFSQNVVRGADVLVMVFFLNLFLFLEYNLGLVGFGGGFFECSVSLWR